MQKAILVKDNLDNAIWKGVYAGDLSVLSSEVIRLQSAYPSCTVTKYDSDQDPAVLNVMVSNPQNIVAQ